jgi:hypothetical protein
LRDFYSTDKLKLLKNFGNLFYKQEVVDLLLEFYKDFTGKLLTIEYPLTLLASKCGLGAYDCNDLLNKLSTAGLIYYTDKQPPAASPVWLVIIEVDERSQSIWWNNIKDLVTDVKSTSNAIYWGELLE